MLSGILINALIDYGELEGSTAIIPYTFPDDMHVASKLISPPWVWEITIEDLSRFLYSNPGNGPCISTNAS